MKQPEIKGVSITDIILILLLITSPFLLYFAAQRHINKLERQLRQQAEPVIQQEQK